MYYSNKLAVQCDFRKFDRLQAYKLRPFGYTLDLRHILLSSAYDDRVLPWISWKYFAECGIRTTCNLRNLRIEISAIRCSNSAKYTNPVAAIVLDVQHNSIRAQTGAALLRRTAHSVKCLKPYSLTGSRVRPKGCLGNSSKMIVT